MDEDLVNTCVKVAGDAASSMPDFDIRDLLAFIGGPNLELKNELFRLFQEKQPREDPWDWTPDECLKASREILAERG